MNDLVLFNDGWQFAKTSMDGVTDVRSIAALNFDAVDLPHDWLIYDTQNLYENSIGWYRKTFHYEPKAEQSVLLHFDGVYMDSTVYVNGQNVGEWKYGYSAFECDMTDALVSGDNEIAVKVVYQSPNSRWYSGAGIYRDVHLKTRGKNYIASNGIYIATRETEDGWRSEIECELIINDDVILTHTLTFNGEKVAEVYSKIVPGNAKSDVIINEQVIEVTDPKLWSPDEPNLYKLETRLEYAHSSILSETNEKQHGEMSGRLGGKLSRRIETNEKPSGEMSVTNEKLSSMSGELIETVTHHIGYRTVVLDPQKGFILNGEKIKLNGVCEHHDLGALGAAFNKAALARRFRILKEMGVKVVRTAHNMPAKALMELADEMGMFIVSEAFDMWELPKTPYDYARFFKEWAPKDVKSWVMRDRNHPSLIMWSIGNEVYDTHAGERGQELTRMLMNEVLKYDPKGNGAVTFGSNYLPWENTQKAADIIKVVGYNYAEKYYHEHKEKYPDWVIYGSETGSVVQSRGVYHFPYEQSLLADDDEQCSALGNSSTSWGARSPEACIIADRDAPFSLGTIVWTGFDYIGEPTPYHTKNSYFGQVDTATFPKDSYYTYQSAWTDYKASPMVHILPYWDFNKGQMIDVRVSSNAPKIELQFNGETVGTHHIDHQRGKDIVGWWKLPYKRGELKAIAYDETGAVIATDVKRSFADATTIRLQADKMELVADGLDVIFMEISMEDEDGHAVENASNRVTVDVSGAGRLIGLDNGDSTDYDQYKGVSRRLFSGKLMAIIGATLEAGDIEVKVSSQGMADAWLRLRAVACSSEGRTQGVSALTRNRALPIVMGKMDEIPVRKIEIVSEDGLAFNEQKREMIVRAVLHPHNTTYRDVEWTVVNDAGIVTNVAKLEAIDSADLLGSADLQGSEVTHGPEVSHGSAELQGSEVTQGTGVTHGSAVKVVALSDGEFRLRCMSKNGTDKTKLISELEFTVTGLGLAYKDPYRFLSAGLYDYSKGELTNGNERGVATARDGETYVGFRDIDFGPHGSDTITIPIFTLSDDEYELQIWEGMPDEAGSELLADVIYQKPSRWNVYQEETYKLSRKLRGVTSLCFVLQNKVHIKGFTFERQNRAYEQNNANDCDYIYGDSFTMSDNAVEGIGNNVSIEFDQMDFGIEGAEQIVIYGHSPIAKNSIQIRVTGEDGQQTVHSQVEFTQSNGYEERAFAIKRIAGVQKVTFVFLPGSHFDFGWFRFER